MGQGKPLGSLKPTLLARKGGARPAMRHQSQAPHFSDASAHDLETDLGWDDMGTDEPAIGEVVPFLREASDGDSVTVPAVVRQREAARARIAAEDADEPATPRRRRPAREQGRKAAFTLRLDPDRHLKLRLACTLDARSAQAVVTEALDRLLSEMPELSMLAEHAGKRTKS